MPRPRAATAERIRQVTGLAREGFYAAEIAERLGVERQSVVQLPHRYGIDLSAGARFSRVTVTIRRVDLPTLDAVATGAGVGRVEIVRRMVLAALKAEGEPARALLGPLGRPRRSGPSEITLALRAKTVARKRRREEREAELDRERQEAAQREAESAARLEARPAWLKEAVAAGQHPLRAVRMHLGLRQQDVAERAGMGFYGGNDISDLERGAKALTPSMAGRLAAAMGVEPEWLHARG